MHAMRASQPASLVMKKKTLEVNAKDTTSPTKTTTAVSNVKQSSGVGKQPKQKQSVQQQKQHLQHKQPQKSVQLPQIQQPQIQQPQIQQSQNQQLQIQQPQSQQQQSMLQQSKPQQPQQKLTPPPQPVTSGGPTPCFTTVDISDMQLPAQTLSKTITIKDPMATKPGSSTTTTSVLKRRVQPAVLGKQRVSNMAPPVMAICAQARVSRPIAPSSKKDSPDSNNGATAASSEDSYIPITISPIVDKSALVKKKRKVVQTPRTIGQIANAKPTIVYTTTPSATSAVGTATSVMGAASGSSQSIVLNKKAAQPENVHHSIGAAKAGTVSGKGKASRAKPKKAQQQQPSQQQQLHTQIQQQPYQQQHPYQQQQQQLQQQFSPQEETVLVQLPTGEIARVLTSSLPPELQQQANQVADGGPQQSPLEQFTYQSQLQTDPTSMQVAVDPNAGQNEMTSLVSPNGGEQAAISNAGGDGVPLTGGNFIEIDGQLYQIQDGAV